MEWFDTNGHVERFPAVAVHGALMYALAGRPAEAERWAAAAERTSATGMLADGNTMEALLAYLRALLVPQRRRGDAARRGNRRGAGSSPASPYRATMLHVEGVTLIFSRATSTRRTPSSPAPSMRRHAPASVPFIPVVLAERGIVAIERDDWAEAEALAEQALSIIEVGQFDEYWTSALVYAWAARVVLHRGDRRSPTSYVARAARLRPLLNYGSPSSRFRRCSRWRGPTSRLADPGGARAVLRQVNDIFQHRPALGNLPQQADELRSRVDSIKTGALGASSLTTAELRLLPLLPTHLSFREIGERLYVSRHTVKTQAISIYRKLGVSSRSETIDRIHDLGLLDHV